MYSLAFAASRMLLPLEGEAGDGTDPAGGGASVPNPFSKTKPSLDLFGVDFSNRLYALLGAVWGLAFLACAYYLIRSIVKFTAAKRAKHNPDDLSEATTEFKYAAVGTAALSGVGAIFVALVNIF